MIVVESFCLHADLQQVECSSIRMRSGDGFEQEDILHVHSEQNTLVALAVIVANILVRILDLIWSQEGFFLTM